MGTSVSPSVKRQHADLGTFEKFLDHHAACRRRRISFSPSFRARPRAASARFWQMITPFAQRQPVGLDHDGHGALRDVGHGPR